MRTLFWALVALAAGLGSLAILIAAVEVLAGVR